MDKIMSILAERQGNKTIVDLSKITGVPYEALYKIVNGQRRAGVANLQKLGAWAIENNDSELIQAIAEYTLNCQFSSFWYIIKDNENGQAEATNS